MQCHVVRSGLGVEVECLQDGVNILAHVVASEECVARLLGHLLTGGCVQVEPLGEDSDRAFKGVGTHQTRTVRGDIACDVDLVRKQHGAAGGESFDDGDAEVFLMRRQDERIRSGECSLLGATCEHAGPVNPVRDARLRGERGEFGLQAALVGAGDDEMQFGIEGLYPCEGFDEKIAALLGMNAAEEEQEATVSAIGAELRKAARSDGLGGGCSSAPSGTTRGFQRQKEKLCSASSRSVSVVKRTRCAWRRRW